MQTSDNSIAGLSLSDIYQEIAFRCRVRKLLFEFDTFGHGQAQNMLNHHYIVSIRREINFHTSLQTKYFFVNNSVAINLLLLSHNDGVVRRVPGLID